MTSFDLNNDSKLILNRKTDFNSELNGWKNQIEREIRKSDEYDNVVSEIETVLTKIKDKRTAGCAQSNEIKEVCKQINKKYKQTGIVRLSVWIKK